MAASLSFVKKVAPKSIDAMAIAEVVDRIETLNQGIVKFWSKSDGCAPVAAAGLLGKSRRGAAISRSFGRSTADFHIRMRRMSRASTR